MIVGRLGNNLIAQAPYNAIANMDFTQYRQCQKHGQHQHNMEKSKILFGVSDPIDLIEVKIYPPMFKGNEQNDQANLFKYERKYFDDIQNYQILSVNELEKIKQKSMTVRNKNSQLEDEQDGAPVKIKKTESVSDLDEKPYNYQPQVINQVYNSQTNPTQF